MKHTRFNKLLSLILCIVLIAAMALICTGCNANTPKGADLAVSAQETPNSEIKVLGEGAVKFIFTAADLSGKQTVFEIRTDKKTVGDALLEHNLIAGDAGNYGLYVKTVNGVTLDFNKDGKYWAFYINGEYAMTGVDTTDVIAGASYAFKPE